MYVLYHIHIEYFMYMCIYSCLFTEGKGHTRSDSKTDANVSKSSLKEFLQIFLTKRKNIQEIEDKGIYKSKKNWTCIQQNQQNDVCAQQRLRSAWAFAQSNQNLCCVL